MRFTVLWSTIAEGQLFDLWSNSPGQRPEITRASQQIDRLLRNDPATKGRPFGVSRVLIEPPIVVPFTVDEGDRKVKVHLVRSI